MNKATIDISADLLKRLLVQWVAIAPLLKINWPYLYGPISGLFTLHH